MPEPDAPFSASLLQEGLDTRFVGKTAHYYPLLTSTQDAAREAALGGATEGETFLADEQRAGRGRLGRTWRAPARCGVLLSVLLRPSSIVYPKLFMVASLAVVDAISKVTGLPSAIKWPNDVLLRGKKVAGALVEGEFAGEAPLFAIVGIGVNVNMAPGDFSDLLYPATSLSIELGAPVSREAVARELLRSLEQWYLAAQAGSQVHDSWRAHLSLLGERVTVRSGEEVLSGLAEDVDSEGRLLLRLDNGALVPLVAGDVTLQV